MNTRAVLATFSCLLVASCATPPTPASATRPNSAAEMVSAAETAHHCAGEEPYDADRAKFLRECIAESLQTARAILPTVTDADLDPGLLAAVRLYVQQGLTQEQKISLCAALPSKDMATMLDDEARAVACKEAKK
jgi:hypothetical protein